MKAVLEVLFTNVLFSLIWPESVIAARNLSVAGTRLLLRDTSIMPDIPGLPALVKMLFTPIMELRFVKTHITAALKYVKTHVFIHYSCVQKKEPHSLILKFSARNLVLYSVASALINIRLSSGIWLDTLNSFLFHTFCYRFSAVFGIIVLLHDPILAKL